MKTVKVFLGLWIAALLLTARLSAAAIIDDAGQKLEFKTPPARVISLVSPATEIMAAIGAADRLAGRLYHDTHMPDVAGKPVVGGAFAPQWDLIAGAKPDLLIVAPYQLDQAKANMPGQRLLVWDDGGNMEKADLKIGWLGDIFQKSAEAEAVRQANRELLDLIAQKTAKIPADKRLRVIRVLQNAEGLLTPGEDSFQTEMIVAVGGIPPKMGPGSFVPLTLEAWKSFNPQVVYACGSGRAELMEFLQKPGWNEAEAVKTKNIHYFPCALTCRAATHTGYFAAWFSSTMYGEHFADKGQLVLPETLLSEKPVAVDMPYVEKAGVSESRLFDFIHRTLLIRFKSPRLVASSNGGQRTVSTVGNSFSPTPTWGIYHSIGFAESQANLFRVLNIDPQTADILGTGADMNNLVIKSAAFKDMKVTALVTAGVQGNALRAGQDPGNYYEPGTINIIVLVSHALTPAAASRAIITVTEAKTAALWDMDVRSTQSPLANPATGTGTDDVIVVSGDIGPELNWSGGHSKLGQLISETVYAGVQEAILKQNGKLPQRGIFERLEERGLSVYALLGGPDCPCVGGDELMQADFERLLLTPRYAAFIEAAFSLSDAAKMGQVSEAAAFEAWALAVAAEIAGRPVEKIESIVSRPDMPAILGTALNALGTGLKHRANESEK